jgi:hypothetical protein
VEPEGDTTERWVPAGFEVADVVGFVEVEDESGVFDVDEDSDLDVAGFEAGGAGGLEGRTDVRRTAPVPGVPVEGAFATPTGLVGLELGVLMDFFNEEVAVAALLATEATAPAAAFTAGTLFTEPVPNVPELRIFLTSGVGGPVDLLPAILTDISGLVFAEPVVVSGSSFLTWCTVALVGFTKIGESSDCGGSVPFALLSPFFAATSRADSCAGVASIPTISASCSP